MTDLDEITRLSAGLPPAREGDDEVERILAGRAPSLRLEEIAPALVDNAVATLTSTKSALSAVSSDWVPSTLSGSRTIKINGKTFQIPRDAQTKYSRRAGTYWVLIGDEVYILSELGMLRQTPAERRSTRWDLL